MKVFGKVQKKKKREENWIIQTGYACKRCCSAGPHPVLTSAQRRWSLVLAGSAACCPPPCKRPRLELAREFFFQFCDKASHTFTPGSDCRTLVLFSKLAARPWLKTLARRLLDVMVARRTCASKNIGKERGSPQVKSMLNALGKTDRCLVGVVFFARLDCLRRNAPDPSRQRQGPRPPNRDVWVRTVRNSRPPFVKRSGSFDQTSCLWSSRSLSLSSSFSSFFLSFFFFSFIHFLETGKVNPPPPPPNGHARILVNAEIYGRSLMLGKKKIFHFLKIMGRSGDRKQDIFWCGPRWWAIEHKGKTKDSQLSKRKYALKPFLRWWRLR